MTANAMQGDRERCLEAGMNSHIAKPIDPAELFGQLLLWVPPRVAAHPARAPVPRAAVSSAADRAASDALGAIASVPGLDTVAGLRRVLNKRDAYEGLLRKFVAGQADAVARTRAALAEGRTGDAERAMHTLKGTAATIGAEGLAQLAGAAEAALAQGRGEPPTEAAMADLTAMLPPLDEAVATLLQALVEALPQPAQAPAPPGLADAPDWPSLRPLLDRLDALLAEDDAEAVDLFQEHRAELKNALGPEFQRIESALADFMLNEALEALRTARERIDALA
jgi:two-component system sensor histidine kinase/response regulator